MALSFGLKIDQAKSTFFDRAKVKRAMNRKQRGVFMKFGAFVRRRAKSSIRKRKRVSQPGQPPSSHTGLLKRMIFFGYDQLNESVAIGPVKLNQKTGNAPESLEFGGQSSTLDVGAKGKRRRRTFKIEPRPFMRPAFKIEQEQSLPAMWRGGIR